MQFDDAIKMIVKTLQHMNVAISSIFPSTDYATLIPQLFALYLTGYKHPLRSSASSTDQHTVNICRNFFMLSEETNDFSLFVFLIRKSEPYLKKIFLKMQQTETSKTKIPSSYSIATPNLKVNLKDAGQLVQLFRRRQLGINRVELLQSQIDNELDKIRSNPLPKDSEEQTKSHLQFDLLMLIFYQNLYKQDLISIKYTNTGYKQSTAQKTVPVKPGALTFKTLADRFNSKIRNSKYLQESFLVIQFSMKKEF
jgi:hypothetical protein